MNSFVTRAKSELSDADLSQAIGHSLLTSGYMPLYAIDVSVHQGLVTLKGHVPTYYLKQMAQNIVIQHQSVELLCNDIEVISTNLSSNQINIDWSHDKLGGTPKSL